MKSATYFKGGMQKMSIFNFFLKTSESSQNTKVGPQYKKGNVITFGRFYQELSNTVSPLEWIVLDVSDGVTTLITKKGLFFTPFVSNRNVCTWDFSAIRNLLNGKFFSDAFNQEERDRIVYGDVLATRNRRYDVHPGENTKDKVYLLSTDEAETLFQSNEERVCIRTKAAIAISAFPAGPCLWWLRTPGEDKNSVAYVASDGKINYEGDWATEQMCAARPVIRIF